MTKKRLWAYMITVLVIETILIVILILKAENII
jgi:hypothetical protein